MKLFCWACIITTLFSLYLAVTAHIERFQYQRAYEAVRNDSEGFKRTIGRGINSNYTCKVKF